MHPGESTRDQTPVPGPRPVLRPLRQARRYQLPCAPSALLGRDHDLAAARALLLGNHTRLLTLVGPPGVGKTGLALALAESLQEEFEQGAAFVDLSPLSNPELVGEAIAHAFGLRQQGSLKPADQLEDYVRDASLLLLLDNFEHVLDASADIARLLAQAPGLVVLATSRTALQLRWERVYAVEPLATSAGVQLFVERAQACRPDFLRLPGDALVLAEICTRLDGLPLAIELAAARAAVLLPEEILVRLSPRLQLLTAAPRDAAARHQTLRRAIDWSHDLLTDAERVLFHRLSVFAGGFTVRAVEAMLEPAPPSQPTAVELLSSLVLKNLVRVEPDTPVGAESRFRLLETLREYAWECLVAESDADEAQLRHAQFLLDMVESEYPRNFGADQPAFAARLEREHPNLRRALTWALETGRVEIALRIGGALHWFWYGRGYLAEGSRWLEQALANGASAPLEARAVALRAAGALALNQGKMAVAIGLSEAAVSLGRQRPPDPLAHSELAMALGILGVAQIAAGAYEAAAATIGQSLATFQALGDEWGIATAQEVLGAIAALCGRAEEARQLATQALAVHRRLGGRENIARALDVLGYAAALRDDLPTAERCFEESLSLRRAVVNRPATAAVLAHLGLVAYLGRRWEHAAAYYRESLALASEVGDEAGVVRCLGQVAALALACGLDHARVARLGVAVQHHHAALGMPSPPVERIAAKRLEAEIRAELSPVRLAQAWLTGRVLGLDQAIQLGLALLDSIASPRASAPSAAGQERLTRRETEVANLIAQGLTNRQIAEDLVIAQRTVDTHVERILGKLSFASRAQVAAWVVGQGGTDLGRVHKS